MKNTKPTIMGPRAIRLPAPLWERLRRRALAESRMTGRRITAAELIRRGAEKELAAPVNGEAAA